MSDLNALTTTAAALASGNSEVLVKSSLRPLLHDKNGAKRLLKAHDVNQVDLLETNFSVLSAEDLHDLPDDPDVSFSLFQGFSALVPEDPNKGSNMIEYNDGITIDTINKSQSTRALKAYQRQLNFTLDLLSIKRGTALDEIKTIDANIDKLYILRSQLTDSIKSSESETGELNELLVEIERRLQVVEVVDDEEGEDENEEEDYQTIPSVNEKVVEGSGEGDEAKKHKDAKAHSVSTSKGGDQIIFQAHDSPITAIASNSTTVVTSSLDSTVRVWDLSASKPKCTGLLEGHLSIVQCMEFDNTMLATGSNDASVKLWDLTTPQATLMHSFDSHIDEITAISYKSGDLVSASQDKTIRQWDVEAGRLIQTIDVLWANSIMMNSTHLDLTPVIDTNYTTVLGNKLPFITTLQCLSPALASGTSDGLIRLWDLRTGDVIRQFQGHQAPILDLELDQGGKLCSSDTSGQVRVWDLRSGSTESLWNFESAALAVGFANHSVIHVQNDGIWKDQDQLPIELGCDFGEISTAQLQRRKFVLGSTQGRAAILRGL